MNHQESDRRRRTAPSACKISLSSNQLKLSVFKNLDATTANARITFTLEFATAAIKLFLEIILRI
jgi:hypothetical protein